MIKNRNNAEAPIQLMYSYENDKEDLSIFLIARFKNHNHVLRLLGDGRACDKELLKTFKMQTTSILHYW